MRDPSEDDAPGLPGLALIGLDLQESFIRAIATPETFVARCNFALAAARKLEIPVILTEQVPEKLGPTLPDLAGAAGGVPVFPKNHFSCFGAEGFEEALREREIHHLLVIGLETPICVYQSVIEAIDKGFEVTVLRDCVGGRREDDADPALQAMSGAGAHILPSETIFYSILGNTDHPAFRAITALVKEHSPVPRS